ncbi:hypothetical protein F6J84_09005 [Microbacterium caowuchunii]|uniref:hypothetical protein n=1 Tax=Microbacterium caowuchunii TaxID=2614638 RepID=UPI0012471749|nr:hypothetical protein [Microbacterium caowuchunii]QEW00212.1 hypothetical protein F6J84_09005 [Microbacterium caowuchunii]
MDSDHGPTGDDWIYVPTSAMPDADTYSDVGNFTVDGETFSVRRRDSDWSFHYDWVSGANEGYGFSVSGGKSVTRERHVATIRDFLAGIDPATGYLSYP